MRRAQAPSEDAPVAYQEWLDSLDATAREHELSYDAAVVRSLEPEVRALAESELVRRVAAGDSLAFETAAALRLDAAAPALERHRDEGSRWHRAAAARALFLLRGDALPSSDDPMQRGLEAFALKNSDRPEAIPALLVLLDDPSVHARVHASEGLVQKLGLGRLAEPRGSPLRRMMLAACSESPLLWSSGAAELRRVLGAVHRGTPPEALDLPYRTSADPGSMARFWSEATGWKPFSVANLKGMGAHDRAFAETVLLSRLRGADVNVLPALRALDVPGWPAHVRAAIPFFAQHPHIQRAYEAALAEP